MERFSSDPINEKKVLLTVCSLKAIIDEDNEGNAELVQDIYYDLSNDEKAMAEELMKDKAPDCNRMYKSILRDYLRYTTEN